ncbi:hypothetical protein GDO81_001831 [Engystomops pustulosus]|uniref:Ig-like domain-containing protein n=1 Tax=Engystomops pustulosus TaxID=76066 RepID=A0AAV7DFS2_ENGPU|nr:hypothetical protein GDO81_001831 [Engystomops pustulosus]
MDVIFTFILSGILLLGGNNAQSINQTSAPQLILEGAPVLLECTYKTSGYPYLSWYVQYPGKAPVLFLQDTRKEEENGFTAKHDIKTESFHIRKAQAEVTDSGLYFCVVGDTVNKAHSSPVT